MAAGDLILVARVAGAFGVKGDVRLTSYTADPMALLGYRELQREDGSPGLTLLSGRPHKDGVVGRAREVATREEAEALRGLRLYIPRQALPPVSGGGWFVTSSVTPNPFIRRRPCRRKATNPGPSARYSPSHATRATKIPGRKASIQSWRLQAQNTRPIAAP